MTIKIIGAGMAGLLAANMLRKYDPVVIEAAPSLPNNHSAVLRFRSTVVADVLGIEFKKVSVIKSHVPWKNPVADALAYSKKNTGEMRTDRSFSLETTRSERYIAPPDLIQRMAAGLNIKFGTPYDFSKSDAKVISTVPMWRTMRDMDYPENSRLCEHFHWVSGTNVRATIDGCDAYASLYTPDPRLHFSRLSITGDELIAEVPGLLRPNTGAREVVDQARKLLGLEANDVKSWSVHDQPYAKINPIPEDERRKFIFWASTIKGRAFSLGRFATWRPGLLADDLVNDVRIIERLMLSKSPGYDAERLELAR